MKKLFQILLILLLSSCSDGLEKVKIEDLDIEYYEYVTTSIKRINFLEESVNNANKYPAFYDIEKNVRHNFYGEEFEDLPYFAEGYVVDIDELEAVNLPSNILIIRNYLDGEEVMYALKFDDYWFLEQPKPNTFIQVYGTLSEYSYQDNMLELRISGEIPEINVKLLKLESENLIADDGYFLESEKVQLGTELDSINNFLMNNQILESIDLYNHLNLQVQKEIFIVFEILSRNG